jgi:hypothetical protein
MTETSAGDRGVADNGRVVVIESSSRARATGAPPPVVRRSPAAVVAPYLLTGLVLALVLRYRAALLDNSDTWFHLTLGERFRGDWSLVHPGAPTPFATSDWVATQWSTEMVASWFESWLGLPGVAWLFGALYLVFVLVVLGVCRARGQALPAAVLTALVVLAAMPTLSARPQVVSLVLLAVTVHAWLRTWEDGRPRWWLVPLTWVWATAHGLWSTGVLLGVVCVLGLLLDRRVRGRGALAVAAVPVLCLVASALTPVGPRLLLAQLAVSERTSMIPEWGPTSFRTVPAFVVALMVAALVVLWTRGGAVPWTHLLLLLTGAGWALLVVRMVPLGAVVLAPLLASAIQAASPVVRRPPTRTATGFVVAAAAAYLVVLALVVPRTADTPAGVPTRFEPRLSALPAGSTVLVEDGTGSWIEWAAPQVHPVIDGMLDAYPVEHIRDFYAFRGVQPGWRAFVRESGARVAVLQRGSAVTGAMRDRLGWRVVQTDGNWVFLTRPTT